MPLAKWKGKVFETTTQRIYAYKDISTKFAIEEDSETGEVKSAVIPINISFQLTSLGGLDVMGEIMSWKKLLNQSDFFYIGDKKFLDNNTTFKLKSVTPSAMRQDGKGRVIMAMVALVFEGIDGVNAIPPPPPPPPPPAATTGIQEGARVKIIQSATKYETGETIPQWVKDQAHEVFQTESGSHPNAALLGYPSGISSWVLNKDLTLA